VVLQIIPTLDLLAVRVGLLLSQKRDFSGMIDLCALDAGPNAPPTLRNSAPLRLPSLFGGHVVSKLRLSIEQGKGFFLRRFDERGVLALCTQDAEGVAPHTCERFP